MANASLMPGPSSGDDLAQLIAATRRRVGVTRLAFWCLVTVGTIAAWIMTGVLVDMLAPLGTALRIAFFSSLIVALLLPGFIAAVRLCIRPASEDEMIRRIEAAVPDMHNRLVTAIDIRRRREPAKATPHEVQQSANVSLRGAAEFQPFVDELFDQTRRRLATFAPHQVADTGPVRRAALAGGAMIAAMVLMALLFNERFPTALARLLQPLADIAPVTAVAFHAEPGDIAALHGEAVTLSAKVDRGEPDDLVIALRGLAPLAGASDEAPWHRYPMHRDDAGRFSFQLTSLDRSYEYRILGGGTWSPMHRVRMLHRPAIESLTMTLVPPTYMKLAARVHASLDPVTVAIGTRVEIAVAARGDVKDATVQLASTDGKPATPQLLPMANTGTHWRAQFDVTDSRMLTIGLCDAQGHANIPMAAIHMTAKRDQAPTVLVEKPGRSLIVADLQQVALAIAAFDDFGLERVGVQVTSNPGRFEEPVRWLEEFAEPVTTARLIASLAPVDAVGRTIMPGESIHYRVVARDRHDQIATSGTYQLTLASPQQVQQIADKPASVDPAIRTLTGLDDAARLLRDEAAKLLATLPEPLQHEVPRDVDGRPLPAEEIGRLYQDWLSSLSDEQRAQLAQFQQRAKQQQQQWRDLSTTLADHAKRAADAPRALPQEAELLSHLASQAREFAPQPDPSSSNAEFDLLRRLSRPAASDEAIADLRKQLEALRAARQLEDPKKAAIAIDDLLAQMKAKGAADELRMLADALKTRKQEVNGLKEEQAAQSQRTAAANDRALPLQGHEQAALDERAIESLQGARQLLGNNEDQPLNPWNPSETPSGKQEPVSPDKASPKSKTDGGHTGERGKLQQHQQQMERRLSAAGEDLQAAGEQAQLAIQSLAQAAGKDAGSAPGASQRVPGQLNSSQLKQLLRMAGQARVQAMEAAEQALAGRPASASSLRGSAAATRPSLTAGRIDHADLSRVPLDPSRTRAIYRLPPHLRDPLLSGLNDKAPPGYQGVIDSYYRLLTDEVK